jgi:ABC-type branched-subunit amino acid transport system permease subunit
MFEAICADILMGMGTLVGVVFGVVIIYVLVDVAYASWRKR